MIRALLLAASAALGDGAGQTLESHLSQPVLPAEQTTIETQIHLASRVKPMPRHRRPRAWESTPVTFARRSSTMSSSAARRRSGATCRPGSSGSTRIAANGYRVKKFRYEVVPGLWLPGLLYEPAQLSGRVPAVVNLNGHEGEGKANSYIQERCINLAKKGMLAIQLRVVRHGPDGRQAQLALPAQPARPHRHERPRPFFLAQKRLVDIALQHPNADPDRIGATGLSGGGWQTIFLSSLDPRIKLAMPVAGYSSFVTRTQFPRRTSATPSRLPSTSASYADYTHLTAHGRAQPAAGRQQFVRRLLLPRRLCAGAAAGGRAAGVLAVRPGRPPAVAREFRRAATITGWRIARPCTASSRSSSKPDRPRRSRPRPKCGRWTSSSPAARRERELHSMAVKLAAGLPRPGGDRAKLKDIVRWPDYRATPRRLGTEMAGDVSVTKTRLMLDDTWTVPVVEFAGPQVEGTTLVLGDAGKATLANEVDDPPAAEPPRGRDRPLVLRRIEDRDSRPPVRPAGLRAGGTPASAFRPDRSPPWRAGSSRQYGDVSVAAFGPRTC